MSVEQQVEANNVQEVITAEQQEIVAQTAGATVFELLAKPVEMDQPATMRGTTQPSQRPTYLGGEFKGIDQDVDPD